MQPVYQSPSVSGVFSGENKVAHWTAEQVIHQFILLHARQHLCHPLLGCSAYRQHSGLEGKKAFSMNTCDDDVTQGLGVMFFGEQIDGAAIPLLTPRIISESFNLRLG